MKDFVGNTIQRGRWPDAKGFIFRARAIQTLILAFLFTSCAPNHHFRQVGENEAFAIPRALNLQAKASAGTLHFPSGVYLLDGADDTGYYYRAPTKVIQHSFSGSDPHDGGVFVPKGDRRKIRGYVIWEGGRTKVGNLSSTPHEFRDY